MTVSELIEELKKMPQDGIVVYKDYVCVKSEDADNPRYGISEELQIYNLGDDGELGDLLGRISLD